MLDTMPGEEELTEEEYAELLGLAQEFLARLTDLSNEYGIELSGCECGGATINFVDKVIEKYKLEGNHFSAEFAQLVKAA